MLQVTLYRHASELSDIRVLTKKIRLDDSRSLFFQIEAEKSHIASLIEGSIVDLVSESKATKDTYHYFSFLLDQLNRHLRSYGNDIRIENSKVLIAITENDTIHFSVLGEYFIYLVNHHQVTDIARGMSSGTSEFSYISSGAIQPGDAVYISNIDLLDYLTEEDLLEISQKESEDDQSSVIERLIEREAQNRTIDCVMILNREITKIVSNPTDSIYIQYLQQAIGISKNIATKARVVAQRAIEHPLVKQTFDRINQSSIWQNQYVRTLAFAAGIVLSCSLLYLAIAGLFSDKIQQSVPEEAYNKLIEAQLILEKAPKDLANKEVFKTNLKRAEDLIFAVRDKQVYMNDVKKLLDSISILKKQMNGVESFDPKNHTPEFAFQDAKFEPVGVFEISKKLYFVGKNSVAGPYIKGGEIKTYNYPDGEEAVSTDATTEGIIYVLTKSNRILKFYKGEFSYMNVQGQKTWEEGRSIKAFNGNLYILSPDGTQISKHKPGVNGFSAKTNLLEGDRSKATPILDFGVDGGFYTYKKDLTVSKIFTVPAYSEKSILINGLPDDYQLSSDKNSPKFFIPNNGNYLYVILENRIWIFEPNSKNYKDVQSIKYIGQLEVVDDTIHSIYVSKDGYILAATNAGVFGINFEISDGKLVIR